MANAHEQGAMPPSGPLRHAMPRSSPARRALRLLVRTVVALLIVALVAAFVGALWLRHELRASLPQLDGARTVPALTAPVLIKRDHLGVPTIQGSTRKDVAWATGFVHAQDRFFQMDLSRRRAAGELSELAGAATLAADREARVHRFRARAKRVLDQTAPDLRAILDAYARGVNAGLAALGAKPFEYLVLRTDPSPWKPEDTLLVIASMFFVLEDSTGSTDARIGLMYDVMPRALADFLLAPATEWETPDAGSASAPVAIPGPDVIDLRTGAPVRTKSTPAQAERLANWLPPPSRIDDLPLVLSGSSARSALEAFTGVDSSDLRAGSNNWAVSGAHTASGEAIVADDMHLALSVPNTWYRASLEWTEGGHRRVTGITLPGAPSIVAGSNGVIAWGFTNTDGDWSDLVVLEADPANADRYLTPAGPRPFARYEERIHVKGGADQVLSVKETIWGPVVDNDRQGRARALRWVPHDPEGLNIRWYGIEQAQSIEQAFDLANVSGIPAENLVVGDRSGRIGWTVTGRIPRRVGFDGCTPTSWADGTRGWDGWVQPTDYPRIVNPASGRIWTANQRVVSDEMLRPFGCGKYDQGARARQIRDDLMAIERATPPEMLKVQLDDRALFLARWRDLALGVLDDESTRRSPARAEFRRLVQNTWTGRASIDSVAYRLVRAFRAQVYALALDPLFAPLTRAMPGMSAAAARAGTTDGPLWALVTERPVHLLAPNYPSWDALLADAVDRTIASLTENGRKLESRTWGEANTTRIRHPLSPALPAFLSRWLDMPSEPLPGDSNMPRVQFPANGASERFAVSPGREQDGYFHMPCGQSGHPLSPHYRDGHAAWAKGEATPLLPGRTVHTLLLQPQ